MIPCLRKGGPAGYTALKSRKLGSRLVWFLVRGAVKVIRYPRVLDLPYFVGAGPRVTLYPRMRRPCKAGRPVSHLP